MNEIIRADVQAITPQENLQEQIFRRYIDYLDASPATVETYTKNLRQFFKWTQANGIQNPQRSDILAYRDHLRERYKSTTVQSYISAVRQFFTWTELENIYPNVAKNIKGATVSKENKKDYISARQVQEVLSTVDTSTLTGKRDYAILTLMITGGLRTIEVSRADVQDLQTIGENTVLFVQGKGREDKHEYIKIPPAVEKVIRHYLSEKKSVQGDTPLFTSESNNSFGQRMSTRSISGMVKRHLQKAGFNSSRLTAHSLRHSAVTLSLLNGATLQEAQMFARHANIATTQIYAHNLDRANNPCSDHIANAIGI